MDQHLIAVLLSWTVSLSQYDHPSTPTEDEQASSSDAS